MEWAYEFAAGAVIIALLLRSRFVDRFRETMMTTPPRFYLGLAVYLLGPLTLYTCLASMLYSSEWFTFDDPAGRVLCSPLWIALLTVLLFAGFFQFREMEARIRRFAHRVAGIPDLALKLRDTLRSTPYNMSPDIAEAVRLILLRRGIELEEISDARHSVLQSRLVTATALLESIDQWAEQPRCRRFARAVKSERLRLREVVDRIAFRITSTHRGLHDVAEVLARQKPAQESEETLWDTLDASAKQNIYTGERDLMTEVMSATHFVYDDLRDDLNSALDDIHLVIAQGALRYEFTNRQRRKRLEQLGFEAFQLPIAPMGVLLYAYLIVLVGVFAGSMLTGSTSAGKVNQAKAAVQAFGVDPNEDQASIMALFEILPATLEVDEKGILAAKSEYDRLYEVHGDQGKMGRALKVMMIATIQLVALLCAILPKYHFTWANESLTGRPPVPFILGVGPIAGALAIAVGFPFRALMAGGVDAAFDFYKTGFPWCLMAWATATCVAWLVQDHTWRNEPSPRRQQIKDGLCLLAAWEVAILCVRYLLAASGGRVPPPQILISGAIIGFVVGFIVPSAFRRRRFGQAAISSHHACRSGARTEPASGSGE